MLPCMPEPEEAVTEAQRLWDAFHAEIVADRGAVEALDQLARAADRVRTASRAAGLGRTCRICGEHSGGGCCSASVARQADAMLLLVNRLLQGRPVLLQPNDFTTCGYLGRDGCVLTVKPLVCELYDCTELLASADPARHDAVCSARDALHLAWIAVQARMRAICTGSAP